HPHLSSKGRCILVLPLNHLPYLLLILRLFLLLLLPIPTEVISPKNVHHYGHPSRKSSQVIGADSSDERATAKAGGSRVWTRHITSSAPIMS
ncbi:hypothetical protein BGZ98_003797, partial [Dissophora globulifera]